MSQSVADISQAVNMQEKQISNLTAHNASLLKRRQEKEGYIKQFEFTSDKEMLDLQMASHLSYLSRKNTLLQLRNDISRLNHEYALIQTSLVMCQKDLTDLLKQNKYTSVADFKIDQEYHKACQYLRSKNNQLDLGEISKNTVIAKAHEMYNMDLVEKLYFNSQLQKRVKIFHKRPKYTGIYGCAYKGGRTCNCGQPVTWGVDPYTDWTQAITFDDQEPIGHLKPTDYID